MKNQVTGTVMQTYLSCYQDSIVSIPQDCLEITLDGVVGDKHYGATKSSDSRTPYYPRGTTIRNYRQLAIVSIEELEEISQRLKISEIEADWLGSNLLVTGIPRLTLLPPSTRLFFPNDTVLVVNSENNPCKLAAQVIQSHYPDVTGLTAAFPKEAIHLRGVVAWVERAGKISPSDEIAARIPNQRTYSLPSK
jgi:hypothetical protein